jgi:hypothetical protein
MTDARTMLESAVKTSKAWGEVAAEYHIDRIAREQYWVHYTVDGSFIAKGSPPKDFVAGPYNEREILDHFRDIRGYAGVTNAYVSDTFKREG